MSSASELATIIEVSKLDVRLNDITSQKKVIEAELQKRLQGIKALEQKLSKKLQDANEKKTKFQREEKSLKAERDKLTERRGALASLNNYKVQQAAEREIEFASKQLYQHEEMILGWMQEAETLQQAADVLTQQLNEVKSELTSYEQDATEQLRTMAEREVTYRKERETAAAGLTNPAALTLYTKVQTRYPANPVVPLIKNESCSGCFMRVGPQVFVQLSQGELVKCPGCGRLVTMAE